MLLCSFLTCTSYDHHGTGIQQLHDIECFIIAGCVVQLSAQGGTHSGELWMTRTQSVNTGATECSLRKHQCAEECASPVGLFLTLFSSAEGWISLAKMLMLQGSLLLFID